MIFAFPMITVGISSWWINSMHQHHLLSKYPFSHCVILKTHDSQSSVTNDLSNWLKRLFVIVRQADARTLFFLYLLHFIRLGVVPCVSRLYDSTITGFFLKNSVNTLIDQLMEMCYLFAQECCNNTEHLNDSLMQDIQVQ